LPAADRAALLRQRLLHLPPAPVLPDHTAGALRSRQDRRLQRAPDLRPDDPAALEAGARDHGPADLPEQLQRLHGSADLPDQGAELHALAEHRLLRRVQHPEVGAAHGRRGHVLPTQHRALLPRPEAVRARHRDDRAQGLTEGAMKPSVFTLIFRDFALDEAIPAIAGIGYQGVELMGRPPHLPPDTPPARVREIKHLIDAHGLVVASIAGYAGHYSQADEAQARTQLDDLARQLEMADVLGCRLIRHHAGGPSYDEATDAEWQRAVEG